jgi:hypothetical protein
MLIGRSLELELTASDEAKGQGVPDFFGGARARPAALITRHTSDTMHDDRHHYINDEYHQYVRLVT